jgi:hypothetical protein
MAALRIARQHKKKHRTNTINMLEMDELTLKVGFTLFTFHKGP